MVYVTLMGLQESFEDGVKLFEHILSSAMPDEQAYADLVDGILKERSDAKKEKSTILFSAMYDYGKHGTFSPFANIISNANLKAEKPANLTDKIKNMLGYKHRIFYYGSADKNAIQATLAKLHVVQPDLKDYPVPLQFAELDMTQNKVYFVNYDMVQCEMIMLSKAQLFNKNLTPAASLFNEYFGSGLSSIVFQEIREAKALAYSAFASYSQARKLTESDYAFAYIGTQANKLKDAVSAMNDLMNNMPEAEVQFNAAKDAAMKKIESERITGAQIFWSYERAKNRGLDYDIRKDIYAQIPGMKITDLKSFFEQNIKGRKYTYLVLGNRKSVDAKVLKKLGQYEELSLEKVFNY
jgi:zinc protease